MRRLRLTAALLAIRDLGAAIVAGRRKPRAAAATGGQDREVVDEAGLDSFPASDPPGWTLGEDPRR